MPRPACLLCSCYIIIIIISGIISSTCDETYSVTIITDPGQGPFRLRQSVNFSCVVEPAPPDSVTYQWRTVEYVYGGSSFTQQNFRRTYYTQYLRYCWYFCEVVLNQTLVGSASRLVEVTGELMNVFEQWV